jgi:preprotein translocase subunit SecG
MKFVAVLFVLVCIILILVVLMQKGRGGGLSGAFAGGMASGLLGSKTGDFLTWVTVGLVSVFLILAVLMARFYKPQVRYGTGLPQATQQPVPSGQPATPQTGTSGQTAPVTPAPVPQPEAAQPSAPAPQPGTAQPSAPASQPSPPQPDAGGAGAQPAPSADTGKTGG